MDKLSYFDILAYLIPGVVALWAFSYFLIDIENEASRLLFDSLILDSLIYLCVAFVIGNVIQYLSRLIVEPLIKKVFWFGHFYSEIFLIEKYSMVTKVDLNNFLVVAHNQLGFSKETLQILNKVSESEENLEAYNISQSVYRVADAKTQDDGIAQKAHTQNVYYSLFRNLCFLSLFFFLIALLTFFLTGFNNPNQLIIYTLISIILAIVFFFRSRDKGEEYINGLFWSLSK